MKPVRLGTRGPAVEDIQRRLLALGYDLGPTGVDGVFLGLTAEAVRTFQEELRLAEDGIVGDETWSALVDAGFTLGDRMLYLRLPHFHGHDVLVLQQALNVLGFACGAADGIFGAYTERAVREFQRNAGLPADGIVGLDTVRSVASLRHVWEGKGARAHSEARIAPARTADVLSRVPILVVADDDRTTQIAVRLVNLAHASSGDARTRLALEADAAPAQGLLLRMSPVGAIRAMTGRPIVRMDGPEVLAARMIMAVAAATEGCREVVVEFEGGREESEREDQRAAVMLLDAVCAAFD